MQKVETCAAELMEATGVLAPRGRGDGIEVACCNEVIEVMKVGVLAGWARRRFAATFS
jgi:hypothetical protein